MILSRGRSRLGGRESETYRGGWELTRTSGSTVLTREGDENVAMVLNMVLSQVDEISRASARTTEGERDGLVQITLDCEQVDAVRCI